LINQLKIKLQLKSQAPNVSWRFIYLYKSNVLILSLFRKNKKNRLRKKDSFRAFNEALSNPPQKGKQALRSEHFPSGSSRPASANFSPGKVIRRMFLEGAGCVIARVNSFDAR